MNKLVSPAVFMFIVVFAVGSGEARSFMPAGWLESFSKAQKLERASQFAQAEVQYADMLRLARLSGRNSPFILETLKHQSDFYVRQKDDAKAKDSMQSELDASSGFGIQSPARLHALLGLSRIALRERDRAAADSYVGQALSIVSGGRNRTLQFLLLDLADLAAAQSDYRHSNEYYQRLLDTVLVRSMDKREDPQLIVVVITRWGESLVKQGELSRAEEMFRRGVKVVDSRPENDEIVRTGIRLRCALVDLLSKRHDKESRIVARRALAELNRITIVPSDVYIMVLVASALAGSGDCSQAQEVFARASKYDPLSIGSVRAQYLRWIADKASAAGASCSQQFVRQAKEYEVQGRKPVSERR